MGLEGARQQRAKGGWRGRVGDALHYGGSSPLITLGMGNGGMHMQKGPSSAERT